jgi:hypothetical protein
MCYNRLVDVSKLVPLMACTLACGRIGFDPLALNQCVEGESSCTETPAPDASGPAPVAELCFAPRVEMAPCTTGQPRCQGPSPVSIALVDLDGDSKLDLIVGDDYDGMIAVHPGAGDGSFGPSTIYPINWDAQEIVIENIDEDGVLDMVAVSWNGGAELYRGVAGGTFLPSTRIAGASTPVALAVADVDADGIVDLVTGGENNKIQVLLGTGGGNFAAPLTLISTENYYALAVGDLNGDGRLDIVTSNAFDAVTVLIHSPLDTTWTPTVLPAASGANGVVMGDWDGDGKTDLAIADTFAAQVELWMGDGSGTVFTKQPIPVTPAPIWLTLDDLNLDGKPDLVVTHEDGGQISTLLATASGFALPIHHALNTSANGTSTHSLAKSAVGDLNGDGIPDIATANPAGEDVSLLLSAPASACP